MSVTFSKMNKLIEFYSGGTDDSGRTLCDILDWDDDKWESQHDFIQWIFPNASRSSYNPSAPVLDSETISSFVDSFHITKNIILSLTRYIDYLERNRHIWVCEFDHNHLRITRVIKFLLSLGMKQSANHFKNYVIDCSEHVVNNNSLSIWKSL